MNYAIYSTGTGRILRMVSCPANHAGVQCCEGESLLMDTFGGISDSTHKVEDGAFVALPPPPAPTDADLAAAAQQEINQQARAYLAATDWYVTRFAETGVAIPADITAARTAARASII